MKVGSSYSNRTYDYVSASTTIGQFLVQFGDYLNGILVLVEEYLTDTVEHFILAFLCYLALCVVLYCCIIYWEVLGFTRDFRNAKRILFVTAHPDDEVMFFGPTIHHYTHKENCMVFLMCMSSGKNYGMGTIRTNELYESCKVLGIKEENIFVRNHTHLPDNMDVRWPIELIGKYVLNTVESLNITNIVTFDRYGVSGHQNHCSLYYALANLILEDMLPKTCGVFVLESVNIVRKYWFLLDIPISYIFSRFRYIKGLQQRRVLHKAMSKHKSQLVWFRKMYIHFSRYMIINTLQQLNLVDIELDYLDLDDD